VKAVGAEEVRDEGADHHDAAPGRGLQIIQGRIYEPEERHRHDLKSAT
jgi:hypothetical protein